MGDPAARSAAPSAARGWLRPLGGVAAQGSQALTGLALQVLAARLLGVEGLGRFAALYAFLVLATALSSGLVGDSLTVLDRHRPAIRSALQRYWLVLSVGLGAAVAAGTWATGLLSSTGVVAFGAATTMFLLQDVLRRLLMAAMTFWRIVAVDLTVLLGSVGYVALAHWRSGAVGLEQLFAGMAVGLAVGCVTAVACLPRGERWMAPWRGADWRAVMAYGSWRALQQVVRPATMAGVRVACVTLVSFAAAGELEAARIYMAPAMIVVGGVNTVLFASYAADRSRPLAGQLRRVDLNVLVLLGATGLLSLVAVLALPWLAPLLTGGDYLVSVVAVAGWAGFAAATAASTPYGQLAAVRGGHVGVLVVRTAESALALGVVVALLAGGMPVVGVPWVLAAASLSGGLVMRWLVVRLDPSRRAGTGREDPVTGGDRPRGLVPT